MYFLIQSNAYAGWIVTHGITRNDLDDSFKDEIYRILSSYTTSVEIEVDGKPLKFPSSSIHEKVKELIYLMDGGKDNFRFKNSFRFKGTTALQIQEYNM